MAIPSPTFKLEPKLNNVMSGDETGDSLDVQTTLM